MSQLKAIVDKLLTNVSQMYVPEGFIAEDILPKVPVVQKSGKLGKYGKSHLRIEHSLIGGRGSYKRVEPITRSSTTYLVESHGLEGLVSEDDYRNVELPYDAEKDETIGLTTLIALNKEFALASALTDTAVLTQNTTLSGTAQFNDFVSSTPLTVFKDARQAVYDGCGMPPNQAVMSWDLFNILAYHPQILETLGFAYNRAGQLSEQELSKALGVETLHISRAKYNSSKEGQTDVLANVWGKDMVFYYAPSGQAPRQVSFGYMVVLQDMQRRVFKNKVINPPNATSILVDDSYDFLLSDVGAAYCIKAAMA